MKRGTTLISLEVEDVMADLHRNFLVLLDCSYFDIKAKQNIRYVGMNASLSVLLSDI